MKAVLIVFSASLILSAWLISSALREHSEEVKELRITLISIQNDANSHRTTAENLKELGDDTNIAINNLSDKVEQLDKHLTSVVINFLK